MRLNSTLRAALLCCAATAAAVPYAASAEEGEGTSAGETEIIVTATRRSEAFKDVAMSVNVATGEQIEKLNIFDAKDIQQLAPGLELTNSTGRNNTTTLRGIAFDPDQGTSPAVQVYFNEMPVDPQTVYTAIYDIQQIEVLRGPQGLLRGLSAPAGSITFATRKPGFSDVEGYAQATVTTREGYNVQGGVSLPFSDKVALRLAALVDGNRLNHVRNVNRGDRSRSRTESFRATLGLQPSDAFTAYLTYQYLTADNRQYQQVVGTGNTPAYLLPTFLGLPVPLTPDTSERSGPALAAGDYGAVIEGVFRNRNDSHLLNLQTSYDFGAATLYFTGQHQYSKLEIDRDSDAGNAVPGYIGKSHVTVPFKVDSAELRLQSNNDEGLGWGVGAFYTRQTGTTEVSETADSFFFPTSVAATRALLGEGPYLPVNTNVLVPVDVENWSFNASLRFKSGPIKIEGGIRYSILDSRQTATITATSPGSAFAGVPGFTQVQDGIPAALSERREKPWTGGVNITYEVAPDLNIYAAYGHSFRAGAAGVAVPAGVSADLIRTGPEKTDSYEVGFKGSAFDRRMNFAIAGFYQKIDGYLSRFTGIYYNCPELFGACFTSPPAPPIDNAADVPDGTFDFNYNADATIKGIEAQFDGRVLDNWDLGLAMSYIKTRFDDALVPCNRFSNGVPYIEGTGNVSYCRRSGRLAETPDFSLTANTEVRFPVGDLTPYVRALFTYRPGFFSERVDYQYRSRELLNLFIGLRDADSAWDVNIFARNLLGQNRITEIGSGNALINTAAGIPYDSGYRLVSVTAPREFGLTASYRF